MPAFLIGRNDLELPRSVQDTALAIAQRQANVSLFNPKAQGPFIHSTTATSTNIALEANSSFTTGMSSGALITAASTMQDQINVNRHLINQIVYILEANGMTT